MIFPDASAKIFLTASAETRADRRYQQIIKKGIAADYEAILKDLQDRDARDRQRSVAPLQQAQDAALLDTSRLNIEEAVTQALEIIQSQKK